jgi:hypothetical protein
MQEPVRFISMYLAFPLWVAVGFADWACHRHTHIERTSGLKENLLHVLMAIEMGVAIAAVAFLEINAAVLLLVLALFAVHELTVYWDLHYSTPLRHVGPFEQMVHSFMEILPLLSLAFLSLLAWPQVLALVGLGDLPADWSLRLKQEPLPPEYLQAAGLLVVAFNVIPLLQETWSCAWARPPARVRARDMIDVQSFIWVQGSDQYEP